MIRKAIHTMVGVVSIFAACSLCFATEKLEVQKVACVGDSITFGAGIKDRGNNSYPVQMGRMLGQRYEVRNFGVNGATMLKNGNKPYWKQGAYKQALAYQPDIVVIKLGTNDTKPGNWAKKAEFAGDTVAMIQSFQKLDSSPQVWICKPVPAYPERWGISDKTIKNEVLPLVEQAAKQTKIKVIDLYAALSGKPALFPDKIHPNAEGAKLIAEAVGTAITGKKISQGAPNLSSKDPKRKMYPANSKFLKVAGHDAYLALPEGVKAGQKTPWLWYCPSDYKLPGKLEQWMMSKCLANGIAVAGIDVRGDFGTPAGRKIFTAFYKELTDNHGVTKKVCMLARSYGGTQMYNWAAEHPESIACLAGIYPVCNLASYPGLKSAAGKYKMSQEQLVKELKQHNPIDRLATLAEAKVPIYHNTGDIDTLVPPKDNSFVVEKRYKALGGDITVTIFKGQGHNYWTGFFEDKKMAEFIIKHAKKAVDLPKVLIVGDSISGGYSKSLIKLLDGKAEVVKLGAVATYRIQKEAFWHSSGKAKSLDFGSAKACVADLERFEKHLSETKYDVIHFNFGLNDIFRGRKGTWHNLVDQYAKDLATIVALLKKNGAKIIWSNITPIPANCPHNPEGDELIYNAAAAKVMKKNNIPINDLHSVVANWDGYEKFMQGNDVHCGGAYGKLAEKIAEKISAQLETPEK